MIGRYFSRSCLFTLACGLFSISAAQDLDFPLSIPDNEQEASQQEAAIKNQGIPPRDQLYQAQQNANNRVNALQSFILRATQQKTDLENVRTSFAQVLARIGQEAKQCQSGAGKRIMNLLQLQTLLPFSGFSIQFDPAFRDYWSEVLNLQTLPEKQLCTRMVAQSEKDLLQQKFSVATQKYLDRLNAQIANAKRLQTDWQDQSKLLLEEQKKEAGAKATTQDLVSYLWLIILILCVFSAAILFGVKYFAQDVQMELIASGQVIQFPTVMMLLVVIISLGLTKILTENSLAALLGGLAGYVLSQGVGRAAARSAQQAKGTPLWVWPTRLNFSSQTVGTPSTSQVVTVTNIGNTPVTPVISIAGDYAQTNNCATLASGAACNIDVVFTPTDKGTRNGSLTISDGTSSQTVSLAGTGV